MSRSTLLRRLKISKTGKSGLDSGIRENGLGNRGHRHTGHLWQSRFYSAVLDSAHWATALRYVECGPKIRPAFPRRPGSAPDSSTLTGPRPQAGNLLARTQSVYNFGVTGWREIAGALKLRRA